MLTIVTPAISSALTTPARAASLLGVAAEEPLARHIAQASRVIADYCWRPFGVETMRQRDDVAADAGIVFARWPVRSIASVTLDGQDVDPAGYAIDAATGRLVRLDPDGGAVCWAAVPTILYDAGYVLPTDDDAGDLPESIERAAIELAGTYLASAGRDPRLKSEEVEGVGSFSWYVPGAADVILLPEVEQLLAPYRRFWP